LPLSATKALFSNLVRDITDMRYDDEAPTEPCGGISSAEAIGDDEDWV
jgi:hypothetical protein